MSMLPSPQPLYLHTEPDPTFATLHRPSSELRRSTAVLLCPPFGFDEVCSYRSLRIWAQHLACDGYPTLRISLPSTGDSGGFARDRNRLGAWIGAVHAAGGWLRDTVGADRVVAIGLGLGGMVAASAVAQGAAIDDLVLWAVPAQGRSLVRQLRAFSKLEVSLFYEGLPEPPPLPEGEMEAGGFVLSAETAAALGALDLTSLELPDPTGRRVLMLERDGLAVDAELRKHLEQPGVSVVVAPGAGFGLMTSHPQEAVPPLEVFGRVRGWLAEAIPATGGEVAPDAARASAGRHVELEIGETTVHETPIRIPQSFGDLAGILVSPSEPLTHGLCVILLNAGAVRRIGPGRMWVVAARRWAEQGVPTLRLDVEGIGDADGDGAPYRDDGALYAPGLIPQVIAAIDYLAERQIGERFVVGGLCAGAYWSFQAALTDPRVSAAWMLNPRALVWDHGLEPSRDFQVLLRERPSMAKIRRVATPRRVKALAMWLLSAPVRGLRRLRRLRSRDRLSVNESQQRLLERLLETQKRALFLFSDHEPLHLELVSSGQIDTLEASPNVTVEYVPVRDHTLRPEWAQLEALAVLDRSLERELATSRSFTA